MRQSEEICEIEFWQKIHKKGQPHFRSTGPCTLFNTASSAAPRILLCSVDAGIELRTVATLALAFRGFITRLDIVRDLARPHPCLASSQDLIHDSARSYPCVWNVVRMICHFYPAVFISGDGCGYRSTHKKEGVQTCDFPSFLCKQGKLNTETGGTF